MGIGFVIIIQLIALAVLATVLGIIALILTLLISKKQRRRKSIVHFFLPFIFLFSLYFLGLFGIGIISSIKNYDIGIGDYFTIPLTENTQLSMINTTDIAYLEKDNEQILHSITKVAENESSYFFETEEHKIYHYNRTNEQLIEVSSDKQPDFWVSTSDFYYKNRTSYWMDSIIIGLLSLGISSWICLRIRRNVLG